MRFLALSDRIGLYAGFSSKLGSTLNTTVFADTIYDRSGNKITPASLGLDRNLKLDQRSYKHAFYSELDWLVNSRLSLNFGFRGDY
jgi:hypothetical protein